MAFLYRNTIPITLPFFLPASNHFTHRWHIKMVVPCILCTLITNFALVVMCSSCKTRCSRISSNTHSDKRVAHTPPQTPAIDCRRFLRHFPLTSSHRRIRSLLASALLRPSSPFSAKAPLRFRKPLLPRTTHCLQPFYHPMQTLPLRL